MAHSETQTGNYMSVDRTQILKAFRHAHTMADTAERGHERKEFRKIARLIWDACGEEKAMPEKLPEETVETLRLA